MTDKRSERELRSWLETGPTEAPDRAVEAALLRIETTSQERDLRIPGRTPAMSPLTRLLAIAAVIAIAVGGALVIGPSLAPTGSSPSPIAPTATPTPSVAPTKAAPSTPDPATVRATFRAARNAVCIPAAQAGEAYKARLDDLTASDADRIAAFEEFVVFLGSIADELERLEAPADLHDEHIANVTQYRDVALVISVGVDAWKRGQPDTSGIDHAKYISGAIGKYQDTYGFADCA